jgi:hypothetical protein
MKITKQLLREMIEEEMKVIELGIGPPLKAHGYMGGELGMQAHADMIEPEHAKDPDGYEGEMAKSNLYNLRDDSAMLCNLIEMEEDLEPWVQEKIAVAASMISSVARYMKFQKVKD